MQDICYFSTACHRHMYGRFRGDDHVNEHAHASIYIVSFSACDEQKVVFGSGHIPNTYCS